MLVYFVKDQFLNNKNATLDGSIEFAKNQIKNEFITTEVGQKKVMRYAPETFYQQFNNGDTSWIKKQFASKVAEHHLLPNLKDIDKDYSIIPLPSTIVNGKPSYFITHTNPKNGKMDLIIDNFNRPVLFTPNMEETDWYKNAFKEYSKNKKIQFTKEEMRQILADETEASNLTKAIKSGSKNRWEGL